MVVHVGGFAVRIEGGRLRGNAVSFTVNGVAYEGLIKGDNMEGLARGRMTRPWSATRAP